MSSRTTSERRRTRFWSAPSGTSTPLPPSDAATRPGRCSRTCSPAATVTACSPSTSIRGPGSSGVTSCRPTAWSASSARRSGCRGGGIRHSERGTRKWERGTSEPVPRSAFRLPRSPKVSGPLQRQRHPVGPPEPVLRGVLAATRPPAQIDDVVLLRHSARRLIGAAVEREPAVARAGGEVAPPVAAHAFDRQPLERWPPVRGIPLLPRSDQRRNESARLQELPPEARGDRAALLGSREAEIQRGRGRQGGPVRHALSGTPAHVVEEPGGGIVRGVEQGATAVLRCPGKLPRDLRVPCPAPECPQRGDRALGMIEQTVEI